MALGSLCPSFLGILYGVRGMGFGWVRGCVGGWGGGSTDEAAIQSSFQAIDIFKRSVVDDRAERCRVKFARGMKYPTSDSDRRRLHASAAIVELQN